MAYPIREIIFTFISKTSFCNYTFRSHNCVPVILRFCTTHSAGWNLHTFTITNVPWQKKHEAVNLYYAAQVNPNTRGLCSFSSVPESCTAGQESHYCEESSLGSVTKSQDGFEGVKVGIKSCRVFESSLDVCSFTLFFLFVCLFLPSFCSSGLAPSASSDSPGGFVVWITSFL